LLRKQRKTLGATLCHFLYVAAYKLVVDVEKNSERTAYEYAVMFLSVVVQLNVSVTVAWRNLSLRHTELEKPRGYLGSANEKASYPVSH